MIAQANLHCTTGPNAT